MTVKALVVDNNPVLLRAIAALLEKEGCEVMTAVNGLEALNLLKSTVPDIVFTDLVMPLIDGEQLCKIIRGSENFNQVFLVVVSGIVLEDFDNLLDEKYYDLCIAKGSLKELRGQLREALQRLADRDPGNLLTSQGKLARIPDGLQPSTVAVELLSEKRHLNRILENLAEGIVEVDPRGVVLSLNRAAQVILGIKGELLIGSGLAEYPWGELQEKIGGWLSVELPSGSAGRLDIHEDVPIRVADRVITASFIPVKAGGTAFGLCIFRDITRQYQAEEHERELNNAIKLVAKMEAMSSMAGGIAHDFNNLLTVICGNLDIILHLGNKGQNIDRTVLLEHARSAAYMAVELTRKISSSSPFGIVSRQNHVLDDIVADAVHHFEREQGVTVELDRDGGRSLVSVNAEQIRVALGNMLVNSTEAGGADGLKVIIRDVDFTIPAIISGQYVPAGSYVSMAVYDSGSGIARENLLKIFDPYFSTKARGASKGMGLGLTVVYATMRNHGGYVVVDSAPEEGTTISCYLPRYGHELSGSGQRGMASRKGCRVMLIDNDVQIQEVGRIMLEHLGHQAVCANSLREGVAKLEHGALLGEGPTQVVLIDPSQERLDDDHQICARLKGSGRGLKIVATGGTATDPVMRDFGRYGYSNAMRKPFTLDSLRHILATTAGN